MSIDRASFKSRARQLVQDNRPQILYAGLVMAALGALISFLSSRLVGLSSSEAAKYMQYIQNGSVDAALDYLAAHSPSAGERWVNFLLDSVSIILGLGFMIYLLNTLRGAGAVLGNLLDGFGYWWKVLLLDLVVGILVFLWSLLLIVPGIIAAYRYSMAHYVLITQPDIGILDCIRESKRLTDGHKGELFVLDLSFIGWGLLSLVPILGWLLSVWLRPYYGLTKLLYYEQISGYAAPEEDFGASW